MRPFFYWLAKWDGSTSVVFRREPYIVQCRETAGLDSYGPSDLVEWLSYQLTPEGREFQKATA